YLLAYSNRKNLENSSFEEIRASAQSLLDASRRRLLLWDITDAQIEKLEQTGVPTKTLTINSPASGIVTEKMVYEGHKAMAGEPLYMIADISSIWILADIYEYELPNIRIGQTASITLSYLPGKTFSGQVTYIYPFLEKETRTAKVRLELANAGYTLKPGMYANAEIKINLGKKLAVPQEAVLDSGTQQVVFLDRGEGHFEPREIKTGVRIEDYIEVLGGLSEGEVVVTSANFLIDSESNLKAAMSGMGMGGTEEGKEQKGKTGTGGATHQH
ncbi:MAG: efflux RND transporter periplasmic adaptor subunit, partial [bacterium]